MTNERKRVRDNINDIYDGMPIDEVEQRIAKAREYATKNDYVNLQFDVERDGYDDSSVYLHITGLRWETDAELQRRIANEAARDKNERERYEELKRKFEGK